MRQNRTTNRPLSLAAIAATVAVALLGLAVGPAIAQPPPDDYGMDLVTIGHPGNPAYEGWDPIGIATGRGRVDYEYRIGRTEITTAQWMEFVNTFAVQGLRESFVFGPASWGGEGGGPGRAYSLRTDRPNPEMIPVIGISWREAAIFCNWLHNGKLADPTSLRSGAYDTSTFSFNPDFTYNDQQTRSPGARFWIPSYDEWLKAAHYDPNRYGLGMGGYWTFSNSSDVESIPGEPGEGQTSAGYTDPRIPLGELDIALGSYPDTLSPWGLLDTSGGATEWTEGEVLDLWTSPPGRRNRIAEGTRAGGYTGHYADYVWGANSTDPAAAEFGLRIASIPTPSVFTFFGMALSWWSVRRSRSQ